MINEVDISVLLGKTIKQIEVAQNLNRTNDYIEFCCTDNTVYKMYHDQDCYEDISGELEHLLLSPILMAEAVVTTGENGWGSFTATWYKLATAIIALLIVFTSFFQKGLYNNMYSNKRYEH